MIAVGIPTFNEASNIAKLIMAIDRVATKLNLEIVLINADNNSQDLTSECFRSAKTRAKKVSLTAAKIGKGYNMKLIIDYVAAHNDITYCMFIDGDITSFDSGWLVKHSLSNAEGYDYVVPNYSRNMQEGNTTNHFIYPLLFSLTNGNAPYQGIAGDFGVSKKFAIYLSKQIWRHSTMGYGVDIYLTLQALYSNMQVREIVLDRKIHNPSFDKMVGMFQQVAESYYETRNRLSYESTSSFSREDNSNLSLLNGKAIKNDKLQKLLYTANEMNSANKKNGLQIYNIPDINHIYKEQWVDILSAHERCRDNYTPSELALSLTPFYLSRVMTYLNTNKAPSEAIDQINQTAVLLRNKLGDF